MSETDAIPEFKRGAGAPGEVGISGGMSALAAGPGIRSMGEVLAIVAVAVFIIGGTELLLNIFAVPQYVLPKPSEIAVALVTDFHLILPHLGHTLVELFAGFGIGAVVGLILVVDISGASFDLIGTLLALAAAVCVCAYFVISERAGDDLPPLALAASGLLVGAAMMGLLCLTGAMPFDAPAVSVVLAGVEVPWFVPLLWVAAVATTLGYALGVMAVPRIGSRVASFVGLSEVLFALGFAWVFLAEVPAPVQFAGGALILAGVILVKVDDLRREPAPPVTPTAASVPLP